MSIIQLSFCFKFNYRYLIKLYYNRSCNNNEINLKLFFPYNMTIQPYLKISLNSYKFQMI